MISSLWRGVMCGGLIVVGLQAAQAADKVDYVKQIKPILTARCYACHGALAQESKLRLDTVQLALKGGEHGPAIKTSDANQSLLLKRVTAASEDERMPPEGEPLKSSEITLLRTWIEQGATGPADEQPEQDPREHWAFKTPVRPTVPQVKHPDWNRNSIDAFIAREHERQQIVPQVPASKSVWLRRVSLDLIGLPPTLAEQEAFLADNSPEAHEKVVNRLLDSPHYGERWGRHWMDIWRYSDWWGLGAEVRNSQKHIWHWRDWIIESLNSDKGYDQMLREMLAADELYPNDLDRLRGTGFLARQYFKFNRTTWLDSTIEHTSKAMLGLTFNCGKCHDHKYDPITQADYYRLRAFFEPYQVRTDILPGELDYEKDGLPRAFDCNLDAPTYRHIRGDDRNPDQSQVLTPGLPSFLSRGELRIQPVALPAEARQPGLRAFVVEAHLQAAARQIESAKKALVEAQRTLADLEQKAPVPMTTANSVANSATAGEAQALIQEDFKAAQPERWEMRAGQWAYTDGKLIQSQVGANRAVLRLKSAVPADFEARLKYVPTGGEQWKSVGIAFDIAPVTNDDRKNEVLAYLSSVRSGPKAQVSYLVGGKHVYPNDAAQGRPIELNQPHDLLLRVRGNLVNVTVDGELAVAYRLPVARQPGALELVAFDVQAEFLAFHLKPLAADVALVDAAPAKTKKTTTPAAPSPIISVAQAKQSVVVAERALLVAEAMPASIQARSKADRLRTTEPQHEALKTVIAEAAKAERHVALLKAEEAQARAELEVLSAEPNKKPEAEKKLAAAKSATEAAQKALASPGETYASLEGALKTLESNLETDASRRKPFPTQSTGRRSALAQWITDPQHPLPARVAVNHLWSRHFGQPLVPTVFDFGRKGTKPTHPELLDWLAVEFIERGWSMKHLHRLIVLSQTYRLSSSNADASGSTARVERDPDNRLYWRAKPNRMEAQLVRDSLLHLAGDLDPTLGGPSIPVNTETRRRSLYFVHSHNEHQKFLEAFDDANVQECYRRTESIVPQQALALENSPLASMIAAKITGRLSSASPAMTDDEFIRTAFRLVLSVTASAEEVAVSLQALQEFRRAADRSGADAATTQARTLFVQALLNHNDFVTIR